MNTDEENNTMQSVLELAAQCDDRLVKAFATQLVDKMNRINKLEQKIQKLIDVGDVMYKLIDSPSISMRTTEYDNALQGWDDAKIK